MYFEEGEKGVFLLLLVYVLCAYLMVQSVCLPPGLVLYHSLSLQEALSAIREVTLVALYAPRHIVISCTEVAYH